jgi:hypothetical protein
MKLFDDISDIVLLPVHGTLEQSDSVAIIIGYVD